MWCALPGYQMAPYTELGLKHTPHSSYCGISVAGAKPHTHTLTPFACQITVPGLKVIWSGSADHRQESRNRWGQQKCPFEATVSLAWVFLWWCHPCKLSISFACSGLSSSLSLSLHDIFHVISPTKINMSAFPKTCDRRRWGSLSLSHSYCVVCIHILEPNIRSFYLSITTM